MDRLTMEKIIGLHHQLEARIPGLSPRFIEESKRYWQIKRDVFFEGQQQRYAQEFPLLTHFPCYERYQQWYAHRLKEHFRRLQQEPYGEKERELKKMIQQLFQVVDEVYGQGKEIAVFPMKEEIPGYYLADLNGTMIKPHLLLPNGEVVECKK